MRAQFLDIPRKKNERGCIIPYMWALVWVWLAWAYVFFVPVWNLSMCMCAIRLVFHRRPHQTPDSSCFLYLPDSSNWCDLRGGYPGMLSEQASDRGEDYQQPSPGDINSGMRVQTQVSYGVALTRCLPRGNNSWSTLTHLSCFLSDDISSVFFLSLALYPCTLWIHWGHILVPFSKYLA